MDALGLVHKLRTEEEFSRLSGLWKRVAHLRNFFVGLAKMGFSLEPGDPEERKKWNASIRKQFDTGLNDVLMFLAEEGLFIPKHICVVADSVAIAATQEQYNYAGFRIYLEDDMFTRGNPEIGELRRQYHKAQTEYFGKFNEAMEQLETLMREHIAGKVDSANSSNESRPDSQRVK